MHHSNVTVSSLVHVLSCCVLAMCALQIRDQFGDQASDVWPRPDWVRGTVAYGCISMSWHAMPCLSCSVAMPCFVQGNPEWRAPSKPVYVRACAL